MNEPRRLWTVARANRSLALVAKIVDDIVARALELKRLGAARRVARCEERETIERQIGDLEGEMERFAQELMQLGCELKDPLRGLLDFPARLGDKAIYLCWMKGEKEIAWWHPLETGIAGRRAIADLPPATRGE
ncbi:MAG: DUF2203 family protein [Planctomycetes bacterium]|nr:DUF2203 family protein [Planctomycetota bacterium]